MRTERTNPTAATGPRRFGLPNIPCQSPLPAFAPFQLLDIAKREANKQICIAAQISQICSRLPKLVTTYKPVTVAKPIRRASPATNRLMSVQIAVAIKNPTNPISQKTNFRTSPANDQRLPSRNTAGI